MNLGGDFYGEAELRAAGFKRVGTNVKIHNRASLYGIENIALGDNVRIDDFVVLVATGHVSVGSYVHVANHCFLGGKYGIVLSDFVSLAPGVKIFSASDDYSGQMLANPTVPREYTGGQKGEVVLGRHVIIGAGSVVLPGCTVAEGASVGALSFVNRSLAPWGVYVGIPAMRIKPRKKELLKLARRLTGRRES